MEVVNCLLPCIFWTSIFVSVVTFTCGMFIFIDNDKQRNRLWNAAILFSFISVLVSFIILILKLFQYGN